MAQPKTIKIALSKVFKKDGETFFMGTFTGIHYDDFNKNLIKNKKKQLEILATEIYSPGHHAAKTFKETKPELVKMIKPYLEFEKSDNPDDWEKVSSNVAKFSLPAGRYYIGDLGYVMNDAVYHGIWGDKFGFADGIYRRKSDGAVFAMRRTEYGDGEYMSETMKTFPVDAGHIGIASAILCDESEMKDYYYNFESTVHCAFNSEEYEIKSGYKSLTIFQSFDDDD